VRIPRSTGVRIGLGIMGALALALVVASAYVLPQRADRLDAEHARLVARLSSAGRHPGQAAPFTPVPAAAVLPAHAAALLDQMQAAGARDLTYKVAERTVEDGVALQRVAVEFAADLGALGRILSGLEGDAPAVTVSGVEMERADAGRIAVTLQLALLGAG
jgi:hypothetical protein